MSGETILAFGTRKALEASGATIANNALAQADDASYSVSADGAYFPHAKFIFSGAFGTAPTEGTVICLYARPLNIKSTSDAQVPETTRPTVMIGVFSVDDTTSTQYIELLAQDVPWEADYYLHNNGTGHVRAQRRGSGLRQSPVRRCAGLERDARPDPVF